MKLTTLIKNSLAGGTLFVLATTGTANASSVIYDNGGPNLQGSAYISDFGFNQQLADDFSLNPGSNTITDIHWWGVYSSLSTDDFTIRIFADNGGLPDVNPLTSLNIGNSATRTDTGQDTTPGFDLYQYDLDIAPISLTPNTTYWLSIVNDTDTVWGWQTSTVINGSAFRNFDGDSWFSLGDDDLAFNLTGTAIPEPLTMLGVGTAVGFGAFFKRKIARK